MLLGVPCPTHSSRPLTLLYCDTMYSSSLPIGRIQLALGFDSNSAAFFEFEFEFEMCTMYWWEGIEFKFEFEFKFCTIFCFEIRDKLIKC